MVMNPHRSRKSCGYRHIGSNELFIQIFLKCIIILNIIAVISHCIRKTILSDVSNLF